MNRNTDLFSKDIGHTQKPIKNIETSLIAFNNFHWFYQHIELSEINFTFVKKIQWQTLKKQSRSK